MADYVKGFARMRDWVQYDKGLLLQQVHHL